MHYIHVRNALLISVLICKNNFFMIYSFRGSITLTYFTVDLGLTAIVLSISISHGIAFSLMYAQSIGCVIKVSILAYCVTLLCQLCHWHCVIVLQWNAMKVYESNSSVHTLCPVLLRYGVSISIDPFQKKKCNCFTCGHPHCLMLPSAE